ncbi:MAG: hypothetical protein KAW16_08220 [candidate division Zixibacteria bacterium]|nr:hypothetical protein [candidate division Zixibacteria bacterium]
MAILERGEDVIIDSSQIYNGLWIGGTLEAPDTIRSKIEITRSVFLDVVTFAWCCFFKEIRLVENSFSTEVLIYDDIFNDWVIFARDTFSEAALISANTFNERVGFEEITFGKDAIFAENIFKKGANFRETEFKQKVDFSFSEFKNIHVTWSQLDGHLVFYPPFHYELIRYFEEQRQLDDADGAYLFLKDQERIKKPWYQRYPEYWFIQLTCGYGVKWERTLCASLIIILVFSALYTKAGGIKEIEKEFGHRRRRRKYRIVRKGFGKRLYDALYFSFQTFIIGVVPEWYPTDQFLINTKRINRLKFRTLSMIEGALGWILLVLFVVTLTRKFIR